MAEHRPPLFLARRSYRRRRVMDAARMLPVAGAVLLLLPVLWRPDDGAAPETAAGVVYLFAIWAALILAAAALAWKLGPALDEPEADLPPEPQAESAAPAPRSGGAT